MSDIGNAPRSFSTGQQNWLNRLADMMEEVRATATASTGGGTPVAGPPGPQGPIGPPGAPEEYIPDLTPPPAPSGVSVAAGLVSIFITHDPAVFTQGHGYERTIVYGAKYLGGPLPTFANAAVVHEFVGGVGSFPTETGTQWHIWLKWKTVDGVESSIPAGGTNGFQATTGKVGNADLNDLIITAQKLADGSVSASKLAAQAIDQTKFANSIEPVRLVSSVPGAYNGTSVLFNTTDGKLYRWSGSAYVAAVPAADIAGLIQAAQIQGIAAGQITGQLTDAQIQAIAAAKIAGQLTDAQIQAIASTKITGQLTDAQLQAISAAKIAGQLTDAQVQAISAAKITGQLTSAQIAALDAAKVSGQLTDAQIAAIAAAKITGQVVAAQIADAAIVASKLGVSIGGGNLVPNASFEADTDADGLADGWGVYVGFTSPSRVADAKHGSFAQRVLVDSSGTSAPRLHRTSGRPFVRAGEKYMLSCWMKGTGTGFLAAKIWNAASGGSEIGADSGTFAALTGQWQRLVREVTIGIDGYITPTPGLMNVPAAGTALLIDAVQIEPGDVATAFAPKPDEITAGSITATEVADNAITTPKLAAGSVVAGKVAAGAIGANEIAANSITTNKLVVSGAGSALNDDPSTQDISAWSGGGISVVSDATSPSGLALACTSLTQTVMSARRFPIDRLKNYEIRASMKQVAGVTTAYLLVAFFDANGVNIVAGDNNPSGWGGAGTYYYYGLVNQTPPASFTEYRTSFGPSEPRGIPAAARFCAVGFLANYSQTVTPAEQRFTNVRLVEKVGAELIVDGAIVASKLAADSVTTTALAAGAVTAGELAAGSVTTPKLAAGAVTANELAANSVVAGKIAANAVTATELAAGSVTAGKIAAGTVVAADIAAGAVTTPKLAASAVTANELAAGAVVAGKVAAASITSTELAAGSVTAGKIAAGAIVAGDIAAGAITTPKLAAGAVTAGELAAGSVTTAKIAAGSVTATHLAAGSVTTAALTAGSVTANELAAGAVTAGKVAAGSIGTNELAANSVTAGKVSAGAIGASQIAAKAITTDKLLVTGAGSALNADPLMADPSAWANFYGATSTFRTSQADLPIGGTTCVAGNSGVPSSAFTELIPISKADNYALEMWLKTESGSGAINYCSVAWYDASGANLIASDPGVSPAGWSNGTFSYFGLVGLPAPASWTKYSVRFGQDQTAEIPAAARYVRVGVLLNNNSAPSVVLSTGIKLVQQVSADLIVDGSIVASKLAAGSIAVGSAAIANGAISNAMLGNAIIDDAKVGNLSAAKLTVGDGTIGNVLKSETFVSRTGSDPGVGWQLNRDGTIIMSNALVHGNILANGGTIGGLYIDADGIRSVNYVAGPGGSGFKLDLFGKAELPAADIRGTLNAAQITVNGSFVAEGQGGRGVTGPHVIDFTSDGRALGTSGRIGSGPTVGGTDPLFIRFGSANIPIPLSDPPPSGGSPSRSVVVSGSVTICVLTNSTSSTIAYCKILTSIDDDPPTAGEINAGSDYAPIVPVVPGSLGGNGGRMACVTLPLNMWTVRSNDDKYLWISAQFLTASGLPISGHTASGYLGVRWHFDQLTLNI